MRRWLALLLLLGCAHHKPAVHGPHINITYPPATPQPFSCFRDVVHPELSLCGTSVDECAGYRDAVAEPYMRTGCLPTASAWCFASTVIIAVPDCPAQPPPYQCPPPVTEQRSVCTPDPTSCAAARAIASLSGGAAPTPCQQR